MKDKKEMLRGPFSSNGLQVCTVANIKKDASINSTKENSTKKKTQRNATRPIFPQYFSSLYCVKH